MTTGIRMVNMDITLAGMGVFIIGRWRISCRELIIPRMSESAPLKEMFMMIEPITELFITTLTCSVVASRPLVRELSGICFLILEFRVVKL